jgi:hypothetical protein
MAIQVSYNGQVFINGTDLSDHCKVFRVNDGQETREVSCHGNTVRVFRAGIGTPSMEMTFRNDLATSSVEQTVRALIGVSTSAFWVTARKVSGTISATNPLYQQYSILDGDFMALDEEHGEVAEVTVKFLPAPTSTGASFVVQTTSS